jgi:hypothetical protein
VSAARRRLRARAHHGRNHGRRRENRRPQSETAGRSDRARRCRQEPGGQCLVRDRGLRPRHHELLGNRERRVAAPVPQSPGQCSPGARRRRGACRPVRPDRRQDHRSRCHPDPAARARGDIGQHDPTSAGLVVRRGDAEALAHLAGRRCEAAVFPAGHRQFHQGAVEACDRRHRVRRPDVAGAPRCSIR